MGVWGYVGYPGRLTAQRESPQHASHLYVFDRRPLRYPAQDACRADADAIAEYIAVIEGPPERRSEAGDCVGETARKNEEGVEENAAEVARADAFGC